MDLNTIILQLLKDVPSLGIMMIVVVIFLRYLNSRDKLFQEIQEKTSEAIRSNVEALSAHSQAISEIARVVERCRFTNTKT